MKLVCTTILGQKDAFNMVHKRGNFMGTLGAYIHKLEIALPG